MLSKNTSKEWKRNEFMSRWRWIPTTLLKSPNVPRVNPRSSGWCDDEEFPMIGSVSLWLYHESLFQDNNVIDSAYQQASRVCVNHKNLGRPLLELTRCCRRRMSDDGAIYGCSQMTWIIEHAKLAVQIDRNEIWIIQFNDLNLDCYAKKHNIANLEQWWEAICD